MTSRIPFGLYLLAVFLVLPATKAQDGDCNSFVADLAFVVDSSVDTSIVVNFMKGVVQGLKIKDDAVKVALLTYGDDFTVEFGLDDHSNKGQVITHLQITDQTGSGGLDKALLALKSDIFVDGAGNRDSVGDVVILLTDETSKDEASTTAALDQIKGENYVIFTIGVGDAVSDELDAIASDPSSIFSSRVAAFSDLDATVDDFTSGLCEAFIPIDLATAADVSCQAFKADVVFALDSSHSVRAPNFQKMLTFVGKIIESMAIGEDDVRVGLFTYGTGVELRFELGNHTNKDGLLAAVKSIDYSGGITNTHLALDFLKSDMFNTNANRADVIDIVILLSDGKSTAPDLTTEALTRIESQNYTIFTLGITDEIDKDELNAISSDPDSTYSVEVGDFDDLQGILDGFASQICEETFEPSCEEEQADIILVVDSSGSIKLRNFELMKKFLIDLIKEFKVSPEGVRVGLLGFATNTAVQFYLDTYTSKGAVLAGISNMEYTKGKTYTDKALKVLREEMLNGNGNRDDVKDIVIFLSDGRSTKPQDTEAEVERLKQVNYTVFAVGIGENVDTDELNSISSDPDSFFTSLVDDFNGLQDIKNAFTQKACKADPPTQPCQLKADIAIIMDASSSIGDTDFVKMRKFVKDLIASFAVGPDGVQMSLIVFNSQAYIEFFFNTFVEVEDMLLAVDNSHDIASGTYTQLALQKAGAELFTESNGKRDDVPSIVILLTDGQSTEPAVTKDEAEKLRQLGISILALGIGDNVDETELNSVASDPDDKYVQRAADFDALSGVLDNLVNLTCDAIENPPEESTKCELKADILIIMDASSSIGDTDFVKMRKFVKDLIGSFAVGPDGVQMSLIVFNSEAYIEFFFNTFDEVQDMLSAVGNSHGISRGTYTQLALQKAREEIFTESNGKRDDVPSIVIVLTDGQSTEPAMTDAEAKKLRQMAVTVLALGIGDGVDKNELNSIASDPDDRHVQRAADFDALSGLLEDLVKVTCEAINSTDPNVDPPEENCDPIGDLVLLVDISTSIGSAQIDKVKDLLKNIVRDLEVGEDKIRVALVTYDILPKIRHQLDDEQNTDSLIEAVDKISDLGYGSWADRAFHLIRTKVLNRAGGERPQSNDVIVLFSDGLYRDAEKAIEEAEKLRENGLKLITVGTEGYNRGPLRVLSSAPSEDYSFTVDDFGGMQQIRKLLTDKRCPSLSNCGVEADIVVVMDASTSIDVDDFEKMKEFVKHLLSGFEIGPDRVRVGLTTFNYDAVMEFQLKSFATKLQVLQAVDAVSGRGASTRTDKALKVVGEVMFTEDNGNRQGVPDIVIVLTDGRSTNREETIKEALELHKQGIRVFAIGIGSRISETELLAIASSASDVYEVENFDGLAGIESSLQRKACETMPTDMGEGFKLQADIVFCFDISDKVSEAVFEKTIYMAKRIVKSVVVSKRWARFGALKFSTDTVFEMTLDSYFNRPDILSALDQIERNGRECRVEKALRQLRTLAFKECLGGRVDIPDVAIIFTTGTFEQVDAARYEALLTRNAGIKIFVVGIGHDVDKFQLEILSSTPYSNTVFVGETENELMALFNELLYELNSGLNVCY